MVDAVDAVGVVAAIAHISAKNFGTQLEPTFGLPTQGSDRTGIKVGIHVGIGVFVFKLLANEDGQLAGVLRDKTRKDHVGQVVVAFGIGIEVICDAAVAVGVRGALSGDVLAHVGAMVAKQTDGYRRNVPIVVSIVEPFLHLGGSGSWHLVKAIHFGNDTLAGAVFLQLVGVFSPSIVVRGDDEVFGTIFFVAQPFLHTCSIVDGGQLVVVHQFRSEDGIPIG